MTFVCPLSATTHPSKVTRQVTTKPTILNYPDHAVAAVSQVIRCIFNIYFLRDFHQNPFLLVTNFVFRPLFSPSGGCFFRVQSFAGISLADARNESFIGALMKTLSSVAKLPITVQSLIASSASRRLLLSTDVSYVISTGSNVTQTVIFPLLYSILTSSNYVTLLRNYSGFSNIVVSNTIFTDLYPSCAPTSAPATKTGKSYHLITVKALTGAGVAKP